MQSYFLANQPMFRPKNWPFLAVFGILCLFFPKNLHATHNRAGEIRVEQLGDCNSLTVRASIITWTKNSATAADRDSLTICWGDGTCEVVPRSNGGGKGVRLPDSDIRFNIYIAEHTYAGPARYRISMTDPNRISGIVNVDPPSSENVPFHIETIYSFQDPQFGGCNSTPQLFQPPIDDACVGKVFKHNPNAFDPDGDSLSYGLFVPLQDLGKPVPNYSLPSQILPGANNRLTLNPATGDIVWDSPQQAGDYNLAIIIVSWRDGVPIDTTIRDMQIFVGSCNNNPPLVTAPSEYCVIAGTTISFPVFGNDSDLNDSVLMTALGGPFTTAVSPATFTVPQGFQKPILTGQFNWNTTCEHISNTPYSVVFKVQDDFRSPGLVDLITTRIKVVGPPPLDPRANASQGKVTVTWEKPYQCEDAQDDYFYGFSVWRREGSNLFPLDTCDPTLAGKGYTQLVFITKNELNGRYFFIDETAERGRTYCYRVVGKFARTSFGGYPYNIVESLPSEEICIQLPRDIPLLTHVDVEKTSPSSGEILVRWIKPIAGDLDTVLNPGPYRFQVQRSEGQVQSIPTFADLPGASWVAQELWELNDTVFLDANNLNTTDKSYSYRIGFYASGTSQPFGYSTPASSVFLTLTPSDRRMTLTWTEKVPWANYRYDIFRKNPLTNQFDSIGSTALKTFTEFGLVNGVEYCYKIRAVGSYGVDGIDAPLLNFSQEKCSIPVDNIPPCAPVLAISNICNGGNQTFTPPPFENMLTWTNTNTACPNTDDTYSYSIYQADSPTQELSLLATVFGAQKTEYVHQILDGLAGCYAVTASDSVGNESTRSATVCVDNCPKYELPNVFTPNGDGSNDFFIPFPDWRFVEKVEFQVYNRWGGLVFTTTDPRLLWDGRDLNGKDVDEGTYYYVCQVFEKRLEPSKGNALNGFIEIVRTGR